MKNQPFNAVSLGKTIANYRKMKNLTQSELAEALYVSHQAISSWENGLTSPDISNLSKLAKIFNLSIDRLLGNDELAATITKIEEHNSLKEAEIINIAPIVKPTTLNEIIEEIEDPHFSIDILLELAPFIDKNHLFDCIKASLTNVTLAELTGLAPFLDTRQISQIIDYSLFKEDYSISDVAELAPFLNEETLVQLIQKCLKHHSINDVLELVPFLSRETLAQLIREELYLNITLEELTFLSPFLDSQSLKTIAQKSNYINPTHT